MSFLPNSAPIGVFDSGVGGLSVLRAIRQELPKEDLIYIADSGYAPYGDRDVDFIADRATAITERLLEAGAKTIVVACNTATVVAIDQLRSWCPVPVVAIEPAIKPAAQNTKSGVIGVLATSRTLASPSVARLCATYGRDVEILLQPCPGLVEQVEKAQLHSDLTRELLVGFLSPLLLAGADSLVLGCTHYPFLVPLIREIVGPELEIIDPAIAVAKELVRRVQKNLIPLSCSRVAKVSFFSSTAAEEASQVISALWGTQVFVREFERNSVSNISARPSNPANLASS